jgi:hypothetical protein
MAYTVVYDSKGLMFEVSHERAATLVLNHGWSWKPQAKEPVTPAPTPAEISVIVDGHHTIAPAPLTT